MHTHPLCPYIQPNVVINCCPLLVLRPAPPSYLLWFVVFRNLFETSLSFSVVRHPFERLVSAYQNKVADHQNAKRRKYLTSKYGAVSFAIFAKWILDQSKENCPQMNNCKLDNHWKPFISRRAYCDISYSIIARAETMDEDQKYIGQMANVTFHKIGRTESRLLFLSLSIKFLLYRSQQEWWW